LLLSENLPLLSSDTSPESAKQYPLSVAFEQAVLDSPLFKF
jgi:hypothetical protein